jgi:hypothetical protein
MVKGFHIVGTSSSTTGVYVNTDLTEDPVVVRSNYIEDTSDVQNTGEHHAIRVADSVQTDIINNKIEGFYHGTQVTNTAIQDVNIVNNTFKDQALDGVYVTNKDSHSATTTIRSNVFEATGTVEDPSSYASALLVNDANGDADSKVTATHNRFMSDNLRDIKVFSQPTEASTFGVEDNFFAQGNWSSVANGNLEGDVTASYEQVDSVSADSTETVAAVNEFALMLDGSQDYSLTTTIS